jgi:hypothetical protein
MHLSQISVMHCFGRPLSRMRERPARAPGRPRHTMDEVTLTGLQWLYTSSITPIYNPLPGRTR